PTAAGGGAAADIGNVNFRDTQRLTIELRPDLTGATYVVIRSPRAVPAVAFYVNLKRSSDETPCAGSVTALSISTVVDHDKDIYVPIEVSGCASARSEGILGILGSTGTNHEREIVLKRTESPPLRWAILSSLCAAILLTALCGVVAWVFGHRL